MRSLAWESYIGGSVNLPGLLTALFIVSSAAAFPSNAGVVTLTHTGVAPAGAKGTAIFEQSNGSSGSITLDLERLLPGTYQLIARTREGDALVFLGIFAIQDPDWFPDRVAGQTLKEDSVAHVSAFLNCRVRVELPPMLPLARIGFLSVSDLGGNSLLETSLD